MIENLKNEILLIVKKLIFNQNYFLKQIFSNSFLFKINMIRKIHFHCSVLIQIKQRLDELFTLSSKLLFLKYQENNKIFTNI